MYNGGCSPEHPDWKESGHDPSTERSGASAQRRRARSLGADRSCAERPRQPRGTRQSAAGCGGRGELHRGGPSGRPPFGGRRCSAGVPLQPRRVGCYRTWSWWRTSDRIWRGRTEANSGRARAPARPGKGRDSHLVAEHAAAGAAYCGRRVAHGQHLHHLACAARRWLDMESRSHLVQDRNGDPQTQRGSCGGHRPRSRGKKT